MKFKAKIILESYIHLISEYGKSFKGEFVPDDDDVKILKEMIQKYMDD